jgi:DNA mismatch endonuclease (patch repair protein)
MPEVNRIGYDCDARPELATQHKKAFPQVSIVDASAMVDRISSSKRSEIMTRVRNANTEPERAVRSQLFRAGFRFRKHIRRLRGAPDIVLAKHRTVVFVHGCFWHGHDCPRGRRPNTNIDFWNTKIDKNIARDSTVLKHLVTQGWFVEIVWACQLVQDTKRVIRSLKRRAAALMRAPQKTSRNSRNRH